MKLINNEENKRHSKKCFITIKMFGLIIEAAENIKMIGDEASWILIPLQG